MDAAKSFSLRPATRESCFKLTENSSWSVITGKTGFTHTRATNESVPARWLVYIFVRMEPEACCASKKKIEQAFELVVYVKSQRPVYREWFDAWSFLTYPLSMTRAATSSVGTKLANPIVERNERTEPLQVTRRRCRRTCTPPLQSKRNVDTYLPL